jgi:hypothetical protein
MMNGPGVRAVVLAAATLLAGAPLHAQCPGGVAPVGGIGIDQLECDCTLAAPGSGRSSSVRPEPRVLSLARGSPADGRLQVGDVIVTVDGHSVLTPAGAAALTALSAGQTVTLGVRRGGSVQQVVLRAVESCAPVPTVRAAPTAITAAGGAAVDGVRSAAPVAGQNVTSGVRVANAVRANAAQSAVVGRSVALVPVPAQAAWIGLAFSCRDCTHVVDDSHGAHWVFSTPPEIYSVEENSPAHAAGLRRGDVLTHVSDRAITTVEGGRRWAALRPGDVVRVTVRRGGATSVVTLRPGAPRGAVRAATAVVPAPAELRALQQDAAQLDSSALRLARQYESALAQQHAQELAVLRQLHELRSLAVEDRQRAEQALQQRQARQQAELRERLAEELRIRRESERLIRTLAPHAVGATVQSRAEQARISAEQQLRYSGTFAGANVEVRGLSSVVVSESGTELIIRTQDATIRLRIPPRD